MKNVISILLCISLTFFIGCTNQFASVSNNPKSYPVIVKSEDGIFQIQITDGWKFTTKGELNDVANLEVGKEDETMYLLAIMEYKDDYYVNLEGFRDVVVNDSEEEYKVSLGESIPIKLGKYNAYQNEYTIQSGLDTCHIWHFSVETENYYGQVVMWTSENMTNVNKDELFAIANTFRENMK